MIFVSQLSKHINPAAEVTTAERYITMSMTTFILIVGLVLLTMAAINEAIVLLVWLYEHDNHRRRVINGKEK